jgi:repressor LexA
MDSKRYAAHKMTESRALTLKVIVEYIDHHGFPPAIREIMNLRGMRSCNGVVEQLAWLKRHGFIGFERGLSRTITVLDRALAEIGQECAEAAQ